MYNDGRGEMRHLFKCTALLDLVCTDACCDLGVGLVGLFCQSFGLFSDLEEKKTIYHVHYCIMYRQFTLESRLDVLRGATLTTTVTFVHRNFVSGTLVIFRRGKKSHIF